MTSFDEWLRQGNYRPTTRGASVRQLERIQEAHHAQEPIPDYCAATARRVLAWLQATHQQATPGQEALRRYLIEQGVQPVVNTLNAKPPQRVWEARSFEASDWDRFRDALFVSDDPRDRVLEILCHTGLRIGDALRTETGWIARGLEEGEIQILRKGGVFVQLPVGVPEPWERLLAQLLDAQAPNAAALLSPDHPSPEARGAAYRQIDRRLKFWQQELKLSGRIHTHKMRRTFAVNLYALTKDILAVQQGLNNGAQATQKYLDESRSSTVAEYQRDLQRKRAAG